MKHPQNEVAASIVDEILEQREQLWIVATDLSGRFDNDAILRLAGVVAVLSNCLAMTINNFEE